MIREMYSPFSCSYETFGQYISLNIYHESIGSNIIRFASTTSDVNTFIMLSNRLFRECRNKEVSIDT